MTWTPGAMGQFDQGDFEDSSPGRKATGRRREVLKFVRPTRPCAL
jgi:hypothetical protein